MNNLKLSISSSNEEVQQFLQGKNFDEEIRNKFVKYDGEDLFAASLTTLIKICGEDEGQRLKETLDSIKTSSAIGIISII